MISQIVERRAWPLLLHFISYSFQLPKFGSLLRLTNVKINYMTDTDTLEKSFLSTANLAFELVSERSNREIALLAQRHGLPKL
jgi:hypothetical protein